MKNQKWPSDAIGKDILVSETKFCGFDSHLGHKQIL